MPDPNLDLGLEYTGGITKPTPEQIGYFSRVDASGRNVEYVPSVVFQTFAVTQQAVLAVGVAPGWNKVGTFPMPSSESIRLSVIGSVSNVALTMTARVYCITPGFIGELSPSLVTITSTIDVEQQSLPFQLAAGRLYQVQVQVVGAAGDDYFGTVSRAAPAGI